MGFSGLLCFAAVESISPAPLRALLNNSWLRYIGRISYGMYLLHPLVYHGVRFLKYKLGIPFYGNTALQDAISLITEVGLVVAAASLSWYFFEKPISEMKKRFELKETPAIQPGRQHLNPIGVLTGAGIPYEIKESSSLELNSANSDVRGDSDLR
jgi:peptidoglycan/LPS O-acetylase OafA/YrhL